MLSEATLLGKSNLVKWIIGASLGLEATGIYEACDSLMRAVNPYFLAVANFTEPILAKSYAVSGHMEVRRMTFKILALMVAGILPVCGGLSIASKYLLGILFSAVVAEYWPVVVWLAANSVLFSISYPFANALQAIDRPHINFWTRLVSFAIVVVIALFASTAYGIVGVAASVFVGSLFSLLTRLYFFHRWLGRKLVGM